MRDIGRVELGPDERRGLTELNGEGEVVSGIAMARYGQNALEVIAQRQGQDRRDQPGLPEGVSIETVYDRSDLIHRAIDTLKRTLVEESLIVALVCIVFLLHCAQRAGRDPDAAGRRPDRLHRHARARHQLQHHEPGRHRHRHRRDGRCGHRHDRERAQASGAAATAAISRSEAIIDACKEVGPALFFSLLIITVSFLPVFTLEAQEGRLFAPLAYTKTFAMAGAALLSVTLVPVLMLLFIRGKIMPEAEESGEPLPDLASTARSSPA